MTTTATTTFKQNQKRLSAPMLSIRCICNISGMAKAIKLKISGKIRGDIELIKRLFVDPVVQKCTSVISQELLRVLS
jgi:hypothetical protein